MRILRLKREAVTLPAEPDHLPPPRKPVGLSVQKLLEKAFQAEKQERFADAMGLYQQVLDWEAKNPTLPPVQRLTVKHSIAFCLLMEHQYEKARRTSGGAAP